MSQSVVVCDVCGLNAVVPIRAEENGVEVWRCRHCGDMKRWCSCCGQGWVRRRRLAGLSPDFYSCDECDAAYVPSEHDAGRAFMQESLISIQDFLAQRVPGQSWWADITVVSETEAA